MSSSSLRFVVNTLRRKLALSSCFCFVVWFRMVALLCRRVLHFVDDGITRSMKIEETSLYQGISV